MGGGGGKPRPYDGLDRVSDARGEKPFRLYTAERSELSCSGQPDPDFGNAGPAAVSFNSRSRHYGFFGVGFAAGAGAPAAFFGGMLPSGISTTNSCLRSMPLLAAEPRAAFRSRTLIRNA